MCLLVTSSWYVPRRFVYTFVTLALSWWPHGGLSMAHIYPGVTMLTVAISRSSAALQFASQIVITDFYIYRTAIRSAMAKEATRKPASMTTLFTAMTAAFRAVRGRLRTKVYREEEDLIDEFDAIAMAATVLKERLVTVEQDHKKKGRKTGKAKATPVADAMKAMKGRRPAYTLPFATPPASAKKRPMKATSKKAATRNPNMRLAFPAPEPILAITDKDSSPKKPSPLSKRMNASLDLGTPSPKRPTRD